MDVDYDTMSETLKSSSLFGGKDNEDDRMIAMYMFARDNYAGQGSNLYKAISKIDYKGPDEPSENQQMMIDALEDKFGAGRSSNRGFGAGEVAKTTLPPLGAKGTVINPESQYAERRGARADLGDGKSTQEIKKMVVDDFKSKEAKEMGFLGVAKATSSRKTMAFKIKTDLVPPASMRDKKRAYDVIVTARSFGASFIDPPATAEEQKFAEQYKEKSDLARRIANAYDVDRSDIMTDYFDVRYYIGSLTLTDKDGVDIV